MRDLIERAEMIAPLLRKRGETVVVAESSTGGLISAALLALPGASAYFLGGAVVYTAVARTARRSAGYLGPRDPGIDGGLRAAAGADRAAALRGELGGG
jgi:nicotinamide-nucleotide amidase